MYSVVIDMPPEKGETAPDLRKSRRQRRICEGTFRPIQG